MKLQRPKIQVGMVRKNAKNNQTIQVGLLRSRKILGKEVIATAAALSSVALKMCFTDK